MIFFMVPVEDQILHRQRLSSSRNKNDYMLRLPKQGCQGRFIVEVHLAPSNLVPMKGLYGLASQVLQPTLSSKLADSTSASP